jgi:hypothetical protein
MSCGTAGPGRHMELEIFMRAMMRIVVATLVFVAVQNTAQAQITVVQPRVDQKEGSLNSYASHNFIAFDNTVRGRLLWAGGNPAGQRYFGFQNNTGDYLSFMSTTYIQFAHLAGAVASEQMRVTSSGVQIGTNPAATAVKLTVNGAINVTGNIAAKYQDVAEWVPSFGDPQPGTVVVLSEDASNHVIASNQAYDTRVAGVISQQPGVILGEPGDTKVQVATTGRVKVMVDASAAPIRIGDLLVTSDKPGIAMKSMPVDVAGIKMHRPGTVVGKALEPLASGSGEILVLLSLQ